MMEVYKDLWRSEEGRDNRQDFGLANKNVRKLAPYGMCDFEYRMTLPQSKKIMKAQDGEDVGGYKLTDMHLEYGIIESEDFVREVKDQYSVGRSFGYDYTTLLKTLSWNKSMRSTREVIDVNIPRKSMKAVALLFTKKDAGDSEEFVFPELKRVNVTVKDNPNDIYSEGLAKRDMYREAVRFFGSSTREKYLGSSACLQENSTQTNSYASLTSEPSMMKMLAEAEEN